MKHGKEPPFHYPEPCEYHGGCKVCWRTYKDKALADEAAKVAIAEADFKASIGYDFGYQSPGSIQALDNGAFRVCCP